MLDRVPTSCSFGIQYRAETLSFPVSVTVCEMDGDKTKFAGSVVLGDLDDFVSPSQACVNPIFADDVKRAEELLDHEGDTEMNEEKKGYAKIQLTSGFDSGVDLQVEPSG